MTEFDKSMQRVNAGLERIRVMTEEREAERRERMKYKPLPTRLSAPRLYQHAKRNNWRLPYMSILPEPPNSTASEPYCPSDIAKLLSKEGLQCECVNSTHAASVDIYQLHFKKNKDAMRKKYIIELIDLVTGLHSRSRQ